MRGTSTVVLTAPTELEAKGWEADFKQVVAKLGSSDSVGVGGRSLGRVSGPADLLPKTWQVAYQAVPGTV